MRTMLDSGVPFKHGIQFDLYNQSYSTDISVTITTRVNNCNHYWVTQAYEVE